MPKASPAVERAPQETPATLSQLKELVAMMERPHPRLTKQYMQDFLRFRLAPKPTQPLPAVKVEEEKGSTDQHLRELEYVCRKLHPEIVNEVMDLISPFLNPNLDLEFKKLPEIEEDAIRSIAADSVFWVEHQFDMVVFHELSPKDGKYAAELIPADAKMIDADLWDNAYANEVKMRTMLDSRFGHSAAEIVRASGIESSNVIRTKLRKTGAYYYKLLYHNEETVIHESINDALIRAISFLAVGDFDRAMRFVPFLKQQRSGMPIIYKSFGADGQPLLHALCANRIPSH